MCIHVGFVLYNAYSVEAGISMAKCTKSKLVCAGQFGFDNFLSHESDSRGDDGRPETDLAICYYPLPVRRDPDMKSG